MGLFLFTDPFIYGWRHIFPWIHWFMCHHMCCVFTTAWEGVLWSPVALAPVAPWSHLLHCRSLNAFFSSIEGKGASSHLSATLCAYRYIINQGTVAPNHRGKLQRGLNLAACRAPSTKRIGQRAANGRFVSFIYSFFFFFQSHRLLLYVLLNSVWNEDQIEFF